MANNSYAGQLIDEIERLKKQIERMKNCKNCKHYVFSNPQKSCKEYGCEFSWEMKNDSDL